MTPSRLMRRVPISRDATALLLLHDAIVVVARPPFRLAVTDVTKIFANRKRRSRFVGENLYDIGSSRRRHSFLQFPIHLTNAHFLALLLLKVRPETIRNRNIMAYFRGFVKR